MEVESQGVEEDREQFPIESQDIEVVDVFQIQLQRNDQEQIRQKIIKEEDPVYEQQEYQDMVGEDLQQSPSKLIPSNTNILTNQDKNNNINLSFKYTAIGQQIGNGLESFPAVVSVDTHSKTGQQSSKRIPIDLVCVVDNSASMSSENKMKLIRKSLRYLLKILNDKDRISIITFSTHSKIRTGFLRNSIENKQKLKTIIKKLNTASTTNIADGMDNCMWLLKNRKYKNPVTSVFLLSDGKDDHSGVVERVSNIMNKYEMQNVDFELTTFGYGSDHDPQELNGISQLRNGNFFYVTELKRISEYFILALSALLNAVVENASISFDLDNFSIHKVYGAENVWKINPISQQYEICQPHLIEGDLKQYMCEIVQKNKDNPFNYNQNIAKLSGRILTLQQQNQQQIQITDITQVNLEEITTEEDIRDICINHLRAKGAEAISEARLRANLDRFDAAQEFLNKFIQELNDSPYCQDYMLDSLKNDLQTAIILCQKKDFQAEGQAFMIKKERNLLKRTGSISSGLGWTEGQQEIMQEYKDGKLALSDDSCPSRFGDDKNQQDFSDSSFIQDEFQDDANNNNDDGNNEQNKKYIESEDYNYEQQEYEEFNKNVNKGYKKQKLEKDAYINNEQMSEESPLKQSYLDQQIESEKQDNYDDNKIEEMNNQNDDDDNENENQGQDEEDEEEEEEEIVLSSLAQKLMNKNANIDKVIMKNS